MSVIGNFIGGPLKDNLDKALKAAPAQIDRTLAEAGTALTGSVAKATALFANIYTSATAKIAGWLPSLKPWLLAKTTDLITKAKTAAGKL